MEGSAIVEVVWRLNSNRFRWHFTTNVHASACPINDKIESAATCGPLKCVILGNIGKRNLHTSAKRRMHAVWMWQVLIIKLHVSLGVNLVSKLLSTMLIHIIRRLLVSARLNFPKTSCIRCWMLLSLYSLRVLVVVASYHYLFIFIRCVALITFHTRHWL